MIKNSEDANKYYQLVNQYIDEYTDRHKISPSNLDKYFKNNKRMISFIERKGLKDIKNINRVISDVIQDRISIERDSVKKFEMFKLYESDEFKLSNLKQCLYKGIDKSNIEHEKILADYFDASLSQINSKDSGKHIFEVEGENCIVFSKDEIEIIKENMIEFFSNEILEKKINLSLDIEINLKDILNKEEFKKTIDNMLSTDNIFNHIKVVLNCKKFEKTDNYFIGFDPQD